MQAQSDVGLVVTIPTNELDGNINDLIFVSDIFDARQDPEKMVC